MYDPKLLTFKTAFFSWPSVFNFLTEKWHHVVSNFRATLKIWWFILGHFANTQPKTKRLNVLKQKKVKKRFLLKGNMRQRNEYHWSLLSQGFQQLEPLWLDSINFVTKWVFWKSGVQKQEKLWEKQVFVLSKSQKFYWTQFKTVKRFQNHL